MPIKPKAKVDEEVLTALENYVDDLDLDEDFEDLKNDYRDALFKGYDGPMEKFGELIDWFADPGSCKTCIPKAQLLTQQNFFESVDFRELEKIVKGDMALVKRDPKKSNKVAESEPQNGSASEGESDKTVSEPEAEIAVEPPAKRLKVNETLENKENRENVKDIEPSIADSGVGSSLNQDRN